MLRSVICLMLIFSLSQPSYASSTFRCNSKLVSLGADLYEVRSKCGEPMSEVNLGFKQVTNQYGHTHELHIEEWVYGPKGGMYHYLRFEGAALVKISSSR